ncbi:MAG: DUF2079 domain-containing protein [Polyangia bacterium]
MRSTAGLVACGASVALAIAQLTVIDLRRFAAANALSSRGRWLLLAWLAAGAVVGAVVALWTARRARATATDPAAAMSHRARMAAPLLLAATIPGLFALDPWNETLTLAVLLGAVIVAAEPLFRLHFAARAALAPRPPGRVAALVARLREKLGPRRAWVLAVGLACGYAAYFIFLTLRNHHKFNTFNWDLGQLDNQFYNALHGRPFRCTPLIREGNWSELRNHAEFTVFALLPFYALHPAASTLLVLQCLLLGGAAIPLYRFAARRLPPGWALLVVGCYVLYPPLHGAQLFDFHFQPVAAAFLLAAIDAFDSRRMRLFWFFWLLAIGCREDVSMGTAILGLTLVLAGVRVRQGAAIAIASAIYFVLMRFVIMPAVGPWGFADIYKQLFPAGESSFLGVLKTMATNPLYTLRTLMTPEKLRYGLQILVPLAFLPLRRWWLAASIVPGAVLTLLTTEYGPTLDIGYQYGCDFVPYVFPAAALALAELRQQPGRVRARAAGATFALATVLATAGWGAFPPRKTFHSSYGFLDFTPPTPQEQRRLAALEAAMRLVPHDAVLAASDRELSHVSNRIECWNLAVGWQGADYIIYTHIDPIPPDRDQVARAQAAGWRTLFDTPEIALMKRPP